MASIRGGRLVGQPSFLSRWSFYAFLFLLPLVFSLSSYRVFAEAKQTCLIVFAAFLCFGERAYLVERLKGLKNEPADGAIALFVAYMCLTILWSPFTGTALISALLLFSWFFLYLVFKRNFTYEDDIHRMAFVLGLGLFINLLLGLLQALGLYLPSSLAGAEGPFGWIGNRNWYAIYIALLLPVEMWMARRRKSEIRFGLAVVNIVLGLPLLLLTWCRGAWLTFFATMVMWGLMDLWGNDIARLRRRVLALLGLTMVLMAGLVLMSVLAPQSLVSIWGQTKQQTLESRFLAYQITGKGIKDAPLFGHGIGSFGGGFTKLQEAWFNNFPQTKGGREWLLARPYRHVHNDALELAYEGGIVGILLCLVALFYTVRRFFALAQRIPDGPVRSLSHLFFAAATGVAVASIGSFPFHQTTACMLLIFFLNGLTIEMAGGRKDPEPLGVIGTGFFLFACLFIGALGLSDYMSEVQRGMALTHIARGDIKKATEQAEAALRFNPLNGRAISVLARCKVAQGKHDEAIKLFKDGANHHLDHTLAYNLGIVATKREDYSKAQEYFTQSARQRPGPDSLTALAKIVVLQRRRNEAEQLLRLALSADRGHHEAGYQLAKLVARKSMGDAAKLLSDNIAVIDARREQGIWSAQAALYLVKSLKALVPIAKKAKLYDLAATAEDRLAVLEKK